jgi:hypothetical protein
MITKKLNEVNYELRDINSNKTCVVHQNRMTKYFMRPEAKSYEGLDDDWVETKAENAAKLAYLRHARLAKPPAIVERFEYQPPSSEPEELERTMNEGQSSEADRTIYGSPSKASDEAENILDGFKCDECAFIAKSAAGLSAHRRTHKKTNPLYA